MQVYREKIKADVEGRPFTPPAPSSLQVSLPNKAAPASSGMANRPGMTNGKASGDEWGDWGGSAGGTGAAAASGGGSGFSNNSEYSKAQYMASAANKEEFFQRRMMVRKGWVTVPQQRQDGLLRNSNMQAVAFHAYLGHT